MSSFCADIGWKSLNKAGEMLCGDRVEVAEGADSLVVVLADGLGSGVKASILSTLTGKIISSMISRDMDVEECIETIAATLPVCEVRQIAYSTFTIIKISGVSGMSGHSGAYGVPDRLEAEIIQYENPDVIILREGKIFEYPSVSEIVNGKTILKSKVQLKEGDVLLAFSDGVTNAGMGRRLSMGWGRENAAAYIESRFEDKYTAKTLASILTDECSALYDDRPDDDVTVCAVKIRRRIPANVLFGPPSERKDDERVLSLFFSKEGKHIVCGGTTSSIAARFLGKKLNVSQSRDADPSIPPAMSIEGVDLATEGAVTISRTLEYARDCLKENEDYTEWTTKDDGASRLARALFEESTDINFYVGRAVNAANRNPGQPVGFDVKAYLVKEFSESLEKMGKRVKVSYF